MLFYAERLEATRIANPGASLKEMRKVLAADWKLVDADTKTRLKRQSDAAAAKYRVAMAAWQTVSAHADGRTSIWAWLRENKHTTAYESGSQTLSTSGDPNSLAGTPSQSFRYHCHGGHPWHRFSCPSAPYVPRPRSARQHARSDRGPGERSC
jgi:hypothetical protein